MKRFQSGMTVSAVILALACLATAADNPTPNKHKFIKFNAPGAGKGSSQGTIPISINTAGNITGLTRDENFVRHGFLRDENGKIKVFDDADAGTGNGQGTRGYSINPKGWITGFYTDSNGADHGFVRNPDDGSITNFDAPDAGTGAGQGTFVWGNDNINPSRAITGFYIDSNNADHGFVRDPHGSITEFDAPGGAGGTSGWGINPVGEITGRDCSSTECYGFLRSPTGHFIKFGVPGALNGTYPECINSKGWVTGTWTDASGADHGFVRDPQGKITKFDPRGSGTGDGQGTIAWSINDANVISGQYIDSTGLYHGFVRAADGKITPYEVPGAGTGDGQGTIPYGINDKGNITGYYIDTSGVLHGFLAEGFSDLEYSGMLPDVSGTLDDEGQINGPDATTAVPMETIRARRLTLPE